MNARFAQQRRVGMVGYALSVTVILLLWQYGSDYTRYRSLLLVRDSAGYVVTCQMPAEQFLQYVVDCEKIMRSLQIQ